MAISVDTVYQKVLAIANKEQRGYITPQEFNLLADQAQLEIFEQYFYDLNQTKRGIYNDADFVDVGVNIEEKLAFFEVHKAAAGISGDTVSLPSTMYRLNNVHVKYGASAGGYGTGPVTNYGLGSDSSYVAEELQLKEFSKYANAKLMGWNKRNPVFIRTSVNSIMVYPTPIIANLDEVFVNYIKKPNRAYWNFVIVNSNTAPLYDNVNSVDFELHPSEEGKLVIKILQLAGVVLKDPQLIQAAAAKESAQVQQEKS